MRVLSGDIGGTHTRLALFDTAGDALELVVQRTFASRNFAGLGDIVREFTAERQERCDRACFGIAGPVSGGRSETTNLPWVIEARQLESGLGIERVFLINDLEANAHGISELTGDDLVLLHEGAGEPEGNAAIISAGTGLGEAGLYWNGERFRPFATEGGHTDFAPQNELDIALLRYLQQRFGHVSWERVVSGPGLVSIFEFLRYQRDATVPAWLTERLATEDPAATISEAGLEGRCEVCVEALELFARYYGTEAGNLALKTMARSGVFLGGGIAPKIVRKLKTSAFVEPFSAKGRMRQLLVAMPVWVILNDRTALLGAARFAASDGAGGGPWRFA